MKEESEEDGGEEGASREGQETVDAAGCEAHCDVFASK